MDVLPGRFGRVKVVTGPVKSDKERIIQISLDRLVGSGFNTNGFLGEGKVLVARHPKDDNLPETIGKHNVLVTDSVPEIYSKIRESTGIVFMVGASHYGQDAVDLTDSLTRSNRRAIVSGLNLDASGEPHGVMPQLIGLADDIELAKAVCNKTKYTICTKKQANRSMLESDGKDTRYIPVCHHHFHFPDLPRTANGASFTLRTGEMFSGKTVKCEGDVAKILKTIGEERVAMFKWINDQRYGQEGGKKVYDFDDITLNDGRRLGGAVLVRNTEDMAQYLAEHPEKREVYFSEVQFFPGIFNLVSELLSKGYHLQADGLLRTADRKVFGETAMLACLADKVDITHAICGQCYSQATESQELALTSGETRTKTVNVGGSDLYEARCLSCLEYAVVENPFELKSFDIKNLK
jgi:thymidine kinase